MTSSSSMSFRPSRKSSSMFSICVPAFLRWELHQAVNVCGGRKNNNKPISLNDLTNKRHVWETARRLVQFYSLLEWQRSRAHISGSGIAVFAVEVWRSFPEAPGGPPTPSAAPKTKHTGALSRPETRVLRTKQADGKHLDLRRPDRSWHCGAPPPPAAHLAANASFTISRVNYTPGPPKNPKHQTPGTVFLKAGAVFHRRGTKAT